MSNLYTVYDCHLNLLVETRSFDLAMNIYASADKTDGWPLFRFEPVPVSEFEPISSQNEKKKRTTSQ